MADPDWAGAFSQQVQVATAQQSFRHPLWRSGSLDDQIVAVTQHSADDFHEGIPGQHSGIDQGIRLLKPGHQRFKLLLTALAQHRVQVPMPNRC